MAYAESVLPEYDQEMANTRKVLERIPDQKLDWQAHPKSHTIGWNANHLAELPNWLVVTLTTPSLDIAPSVARLTRSRIWPAPRKFSALSIATSPRGEQHSRPSRTRRSARCGRSCEVVVQSSPCRGRRWFEAWSSTTSSTIARSCVSIFA